MVVDGIAAVEWFSIVVAVALQLLAYSPAAERAIGRMCERKLRVFHLDARRLWKGLLVVTIASGALLSRLVFAVAPDHRRTIMCLTICIVVISFSLAMVLWRISDIAAMQLRTYEGSHGSEREKLRE